MRRWGLRGGSAAERSGGAEGDGGGGWGGREEARVARAGGAQGTGGAQGHGSTARADGLGGFEGTGEVAAVLRLRRGCGHAASGSVFPLLPRSSSARCFQKGRSAWDQATEGERGEMGRPRSLCILFCPYMYRVIVVPVYSYVSICLLFYFSKYQVV